MEPEGLLIDGARKAAVAARELWWRARPPQARGELPLARVKRRLELVVGALLRRRSRPSCRAIRRPDRRGSHVCSGVRPDICRRARRRRRPMGTSVWLPRAHGDRRRRGRGGGDVSAAGARAGGARGPRHAGRAPRAIGSSATSTRSRRRRRWIGQLARESRRDRGRPARGPRARAARAALARAADARWSAASSGSCGRRSRRILPRRRPPIPLSATPTESRLWARATAERLRRTAASYRGVAVVPLWGQLVVAAPSVDDRPTARRGEPSAEGRSAAHRCASGRACGRPPKTRTTSGPGLG